MRPTFRLLQALQQGGTKRVIEYAQTGITGLGTHPSPRPTLLTIYNRTLQQLQKLPQDSLYRASVESITRHRQSIVEDVQPHGFAEYIQELKKRGSNAPSYDGELVKESISSDTITAIWSQDVGYDAEGDPDGQLQPENRHKKVRGVNMTPTTKVQVKEDELREPDLSVEQVQHIEAKIGGGLIEEIIEIAYNELKLAETMEKDKIWEPLVEQPVQGQWQYFERKTV